METEVRGRKTRTATKIGMGQGGGGALFVLRKVKNYSKNITGWAACLYYDTLITILFFVNLAQHCSHLL